MDNNRNTYLAIGLSILIIIGWQYFYVGPRVEAERQAAQIEAERQAELAKSNITQNSEGNSVVQTQDGVPRVQSTVNQDAAVPGGNTANGSLTREAAISNSNRIFITTERLSGSINLKGARIDDLSLNEYHVTVDKSSPKVVLLSPVGTGEGYFAEFGFAGTKDVGGVPGPNTEWTNNGSDTLETGGVANLSWTNEKGVVFKRRIELDANFMFTYTDTVENNSAQAISLTPWGRIARFYKPETPSLFILHEGLIGYFGEDGLNEIDYSDVEDDKEYKFAETDKGWLGITDKYWATALIPNSAFTAKFSYRNSGRDHFQTDFVSRPVTVQAGGKTELKNYLFAGAKEASLINDYQEQLGLFKFDFMIDWGWFYFLTKPMAWVIDKLYSFVGNFGIAILMITVLVKAVFYPLANLSYASMAKMKKVQPEMTQLRERFADDRAKQQQELMALYKKEKINPAAGCWPILIQIPVFFALYKVIYVTIEMRHAPFFGWIQDLSAPDPTSIFNLFGLLPYDVPSFLLIGIWPLIMGVTMFLQMRMNPAPPDPTQQMIFNWMPIVFTFMLATFPAGLVIYWAWNNTLSIIQQGLIMRSHGVKIELWDNLKSLVGLGKKSDA